LGHFSTGTGKIAPKKHAETSTLEAPSRFVFTMSREKSERIRTKGKWNNPTGLPVRNRQDPSFLRSDPQRFQFSDPLLPVSDLSIIRHRF